MSHAKTKKRYFGFVLFFDFGTLSENPDNSDELEPPIQKTIDLLPHQDISFHSHLHKRKTTYVVYVRVRDSLIAKPFIT